MTRPIMHSHLKKHTAVARATAGKVLASRCARQGQSTRRGLSSPPMKRSTYLDHLVSRSSYRVKLLLQLRKRVPAPSFSTGLALSSVDSQRRRADKAHKVEGTR